MYREKRKVYIILRKEKGVLGKDKCAIESEKVKYFVTKFESCLGQSVYLSHLVKS